MSGISTAFYDPFDLLARQARVDAYISHAVTMVGTRSRAIRRSTFQAACRGKKGGTNLQQGFC